jgi:hypothetical protein
LRLALAEWGLNEFKDGRPKTARMGHPSGLGWAEELGFTSSNVWNLVRKRKIQ